jgi:hypothetical protein
MVDTQGRRDRGMRVITVRQPWASAIAAPEGKRVENRRWTTAWRGDLAIHAGLAWDPVGADDPRVLDALGVTSIEPADLLTGVVVARCRLDSIHEGAGAFCCPWGDPKPGIFHLCLTDVVRLAHPVAMTGQLGMRVLTPSEEGDVRRG